MSEAEAVLLILRDLERLAETDDHELGPRDRAAVLLSRRWLEVLRRAGMLDTLLQKELF